MSETLKTRLFLAICVFAIAWGAYDLWSDRALPQPEGILVPRAPSQISTEGTRVPSFERAGHAIKPLAKYEITARVLSKERYRWDRGAKLVPFDVTVGWGPMSDSAILRQLDISQDNRFYNWRAKSLPLPQDEINRSAANMHLIAGGDLAAKTISRLRPGQVISMRGFLVEAVGTDGSVWRSSLSREDSGGGACELMWVESIDVN
jgi:hypothetical protein